MTLHDDHQIHFSGRGCKNCLCGRPRRFAGVLETNRIWFLAKARNHPDQVCTVCRERLHVPAPDNRATGLTGPPVANCGPG